MRANNDEKRKQKNESKNKLINELNMIANYRKDTETSLLGGGQHDDISDLSYVQNEQPPEPKNVPD